MANPVADFYRENPRMVSSPFGGVEGLNSDLLESVFCELDIELSGKKILDVGCGRGFASDLVHRAGGDYTGLDFVSSRVGFRLTLGDAAALPYGDSSFDGVFCVDAFEHFPEPERAASEIRRVLRPGGFFYLSAPNYSNVAGLVKWVYEELGIYERDTWAPFGRWQPQELETPLTGRLIKRIFYDAGFEKIRRIGHGAEVGLGLFPWIDHRNTPDSIRFRLQRVFGLVGGPIAKVWPGSSLHNFWKMDV